MQAIDPKPATSQPGTDHRVYHYLLRGMAATIPDQVWSTDITYIRLTGGFVYLVSILDGYSHKVLAWQLSNTLDATFCLECLDEALARRQPTIFNTDQGAQFTSVAFTRRRDPDQHGWAGTGA